MDESDFAVLREEMVKIVMLHAHHAGPQTNRAEIDHGVLKAMLQVPRHHFVPSEVGAYAYFDSPLPIGFGKTISQPFIAALMADLLELEPSQTVLEVGTGLGYQAAMMSTMVDQVCSVEIIEELADEAKDRLAQQDYGNVALRVGDGAQGWPEHAPFDRIVVTAAPDLIPPMLLHQLKPGGRMVIPTGVAEAQSLLLVTKDSDNRIESTEILPVRFAQLETDEDLMGSPVGLLS